MRVKGKFHCFVAWARNIPIGDSKSTDAYVKVHFPQKGKEKKTKTIKENLNPMWNQRLE